MVVAKLRPTYMSTLQSISKIWPSFLGVPAAMVGHFMLQIQENKYVRKYDMFYLKKNSLIRLAVVSPNLCFTVSCFYMSVFGNDEVAISMTLKKKGTHCCLNV